MVMPVTGQGASLPAAPASPDPVPGARAATAPGGRYAAAQAPAASASAADVEAVVMRYLMAAREESRTTRGIAAMRDSIRRAETARALRLGMRRARQMRRSAVLNGALGIASGLCKAGESIAGAFAGSAGSGGKAARGFGKASDVTSGVLDRIGPLVDTHADRAERLDVRREEARSEADEAAAGAAAAADHGQVAADAARRALEILDRCARAGDAAVSIALSRQG